MNIRRHAKLFVGGTLAGVLLLLMLAASGSLLKPNAVPVLPTLMQLDDHTEDADTAANPNSSDVADNSASDSAESVGNPVNTVSQPAATPLPTNTDPSSDTLSASPVNSAPITSIASAPINLFQVEVPQAAVPNTLVLRFKAGTTQAEQLAYIASFGGEISSTIEALNTVIVTVPANMTQAALPASALVEAAEPDYYLSALESPTTNDTFFAEQWAIPVMGVPPVWAQMPADAPLITVAVVDSGVCQTHLDLQGRLDAGWDFVENDATPQDEFGHGCAVTGVIAAVANNGIGIAGLAPNAQIMPLRVLDAYGVGSYSRVAAATVYAVDHGAQIINLSLGGASPSGLLQDAVGYAHAHNVMVIAAAGNQGSDSAMYPAAYETVIAVGSVDKNLGRSSFSNYGDEIDIYAPGRDIITTALTGYGYMSGTSLAAPQVAGAAVLTKTLGLTLVLDGGVLKLNAPAPTNPDTGAVIVVPVCDMAQTRAAEAAFLDAVRQPGATQATIQAARVHYLTVAAPCFVDLYNTGEFSIDAGGRWNSETSAQFQAFGTKWGIPEPTSFDRNRPPGTPGGTVTYSFMPNNVSLATEEGVAAGENIVAIDSLTGAATCDFRAEIRAAFIFWGAAANIQFVEVPDGGPQAAFNAPNGGVGMIRIGAHLIDGPRGELGHAYFPPPDPSEPNATGTGDIHFDVGESWGCGTVRDAAGNLIQIDIGLVAQHEIGHAIGLQHQSPNVLAMMNPTYRESLTANQPNGLQDDDKTGARMIYGVEGLGIVLATAPVGPISTNLPTFTWEGDGFQQYNIQIDDADDFASPLIDTTVLDGAETFIPTLPFANGTFFWRVRGYETGWGEWSNVVAFNVSIAIPSLIEPINNAVLATTNVEFQWSNVAGDNNLFTLQISSDAEFTADGIEQTLAAIPVTSQTVTLEAGAYFWRVQRVGGDWSPIQQFTIDTNVPLLSSPSHGAFLTDPIVDFQWNAVDGASEYQMQLDTSPNFVGLLFLDRLFLDRLFLDRLFLDRLFLDRLFLDRLFLDRLFLDRLFLDRLFLDRLFLDRLFLDRLFLDRLFLDRLFLDRLFLDRLFINKITTNNLTLEKPLSDGTHYWRVRALREDGTWTGWSDPYQLTVETPGRSQVVINEVQVADPSWVEIYNGDDAPIDLSTWKLVAYTPTGVMSISYQFPAGFTIPANGYIILHEENGTNTATDLYMGPNTIDFPLPGNALALNMEADVAAMVTNEQVDLLAGLLNSATSSEALAAQAEAAGMAQTNSTSAQAVIPQSAQETTIVSAVNDSLISNNSETEPVATPVPLEVSASSTSETVALDTVSAAAAPEITAQSVITVTTNLADENPTDGFCSLIEAINSANTNTPSGGVAGECPAGGVAGTDEILLVSDATYSISVTNNTNAGANALPAITSAIHIKTDGAGAAFIQRPLPFCSSGTPMRLFFVGGTGILTLDNIVVQYGCNVSGDGGGAIYVQADGKLLLNASSLTFNESTAYGGAVMLQPGAEADFVTSVLSSNTAGIRGGAAYVQVGAQLDIQGGTVASNQTTSTGAGGAIYSEGTLNITAAQFMLNESPSVGTGGALALDTSSDTIITDSTFNLNTAADRGGAIHNKGSLRIMSSTLTANSSNNVGSAVGSALHNEGGHVKIVNSTFSDNNASGGLGGTISLTGTSPTLQISDSTITNDTAGSVLHIASGGALIKNSIIADDNANDCAAGTPTFEGVNFLTDATCGADNGATRRVVAFGALALDVLEDNGGPTSSRRLLGGSVAINAASNCDTLDEETLIVDQRGYGRDLVCDVGAFEVSDDIVQEAPSYNVNTFDMTKDGICGYTHCSLPDAITLANLDGVASEISLPDGAYNQTVVDNTLVGANAFPVIDTDIAISGEGAVITRSVNAMRLFYVDSGGTLTLNNIKLLDGSSNIGGALYVSAGGTASINNSEVSDNSVTDVDIGGGAIYSAGTLYLWNTRLANNFSGSAGGALLLADNSTTTITESTLSNNTTFNNGGAIFVEGDLVLDRSLLTGNSTNTFGSGGGSALFISEDANVTIVNSTISHNTVGQIGRGSIVATDNSPNLNISSSTIADELNGVALELINADVIIRNSIISSNIADNCFLDVYGFLTFEGVNFVTDETCGAENLPVLDYVAAPELNMDVLEANGGPTQTRALFTGSVAINAVGVSDCTRIGGGAISTDQRGVSRVINAPCDAGAFEFDSEISQPPDTYTVNTTDMDEDGVCGVLHCSLKDAINAANGDGVASTINLANGTSYSMFEISNFAHGNTGLPLITSEITINANGSTIYRDSEGLFRIFYVANGGNLTLNNAIVKWGYGNGAVKDGGGIYIAVGGTATINSSWLHTNVGENGGGIYNVGTLNLYRSTVSNNDATINGGGVYFGTTAQDSEIGSSTISGNVATNIGGGLYVSATATGTLDVGNSTIAANRADNDASNLFTVEGNTFLTNSLLADPDGGTNCGDTGFGFGSLGLLVNFMTDDSCFSDSPPGWDVVTSVELNLGSLMANGGLAPTHSLREPSVAIDAVSIADCVGSGGIDQRGVARPQGAACDAGAFEVEEGVQTGPVFTVNVANDNNGVCDVTDCSLREAIMAANARANGSTPDEIHFNISGSGPHTIAPLSALPIITNAVIIDGYSQPGSAFNTLPASSNAVLMIELDGSSAGVSNGLELDASAPGSLVRGLVINNFASEGVRVAADHVLIAGNFIGTNTSGSAAASNGGSGVAIYAAAHVMIGGTPAGNRNVISGNGFDGISIWEAGSVNTTIYGNLIGIAADGFSNLGNTPGAVGGGIALRNSPQNTIIGGINPGEGNVIAFNNEAGIRDYSGVNTTIRGNRIFNNVGLGIDLDGASVTANDTPDVDGSQNFPVLTAAAAHVSSTTLIGSLTSTPNQQFSVDVYATSACDGSSYGEGALYLGTIDIDLDSSGTKLISATFGDVLTPGTVLTAIATNAQGASSEFSNCIIAAVDIAQAAPDYMVTTLDTTDDTLCGMAHCSLIEAINAANGDSVDSSITPLVPVTYTLDAVNSTNTADGSPNGLPIITSPIVINGNSSTIERSFAGGTPQFRIFTVGDGGDLTLNNITLRNGYGDRGGAAFIASGGRLTLNYTTLDNNTANGGGGVYADDNLYINNSILSSNEATGDGGGIFAALTSEITIVNSTLSGNIAGNSGGGIVTGSGADPTIRISSSSIIDNNGGGGAGLMRFGGTYIVKNSILANDPSRAWNCDEPLASLLGTNFIVGQGCGAENPPSLDFVTADELNLGPLVNNGGATWTYALQMNSVAIDAATDCTTIAGDPIPVDQRGVGRPFGDFCDVGAFEVSSVPFGTVGGSLALVQGLSVVDFVRFGDTNLAPPTGTNWTGGTIELPLGANTLGRNPFSTDSDDRLDWASLRPTLGSQNGVYVVVNEVFTGTIDAVELANPGIETASMDNWTINIYNDLGAVDATYTFPAGFTLAPRSFVVLYESAGATIPGAIYLNDGINWSSWNGAGGVVITNAIGAGVDYMRFGGSQEEVGGEADAAFISTDDADAQQVGALDAVDDIPVPRGTGWNEDVLRPISPLPNQSLGRDSLSSDFDRGDDWFAAASSLGNVNPISRPAPNDEFELRTIIPGVPFRDTQSTTAATHVNEPEPTCAVDVGYTLWYQYTATEADALADTLRFQTDGSDFDTVLAIYTGNFPALVEVACNDNHEGNPRSRIDLAVTAGTTYYIMVGGNLNGSGNLTFSVKPPANDTFADALVIPTLPYSDTQNTLAASQSISDPTASCGVGAGRSVWYQYTAVADEEMRFDTSGSLYDTAVTVFTGTPGNLVEVACADGGGTDATGSLAVNLVTGSTYFIMVSGNQDAGGTLVFQASLLTQPDNDFVENATNITLPYTRTQDTFGATVSDADSAPSCGANVGKTVWYQYTAEVDAPVTFRTLDSGFDTVLSIWTGEPGNLTEVDCNDDALGGATSLLELAAPVPGTTYYIMIGGYQQAGGTLVFEAQSPAAPPANDEYAHAFIVELAGTPLAYDFTQATTGASVSFGDPVPSCAPEAGKTVWYRYNSSASTTLSIQTNSSDYDTVLSVWLVNDDDGTATEIGCNDNAGSSSQSQLLISTDEGTTLFIMVAGYRTSSIVGAGTLNLHIESVVELPANDAADEARLIDPLPYTDSQSTLQATYAENDPIPACTPVVGRTVWYQYTATTNDDILRLNTNGSDFATALSVWTGEPGSLVEVACGTTSVDVTTTAGTTYLVMVGGVNGVSGQLVLNAELLAAPSNDEIENALPLLSGEVIDLAAITPLDTRAATRAGDDPILPCNADVSKTVWYILTIEATGTLNLTTEGSNYNTVMAIFSGAPGDLMLIACDDNSGSNFTARIQGLNLHPGDYYVMVGSALNQGGTLHLNAQLFEAPANDAPAAALPITAPSDTTQNTEGATGAGDPAVCGTTPNKTVWYTYTPDAHGILQLSFDGTSFGSIAAVFTGTPPALTQLGCAVDATLEVPVTPGQTYLIMIGSVDVNGGTLNFHLELLPPTDLPSSMTVTLGANVSSVVSPSGAVIYTVSIHNTSVEDAILIQSITSDLDGVVTCAAPLPMLAVGGSFDCVYTGTVTGIPGASRTNTITVNALDDDGAPLQGTANTTITVTAAIFNGLRGEYYNNADFTARVLTRIDPTIHFDWGNGSPDPSIGKNTFSVRWTGKVKPAFTERYTFYVKSDDGVRLWVNGQQVLDIWYQGGPGSGRGSIDLVGGELYDIRLEYFDSQSAANIRLQWSSTSTPRDVIPASALFVFVPPRAKAGVDQSVTAAVGGTALVTLDGSASSDDGVIVSYDWSLNGGSIATGAQPQVTLPVGTHEITLTVMDNSGLTATDTVKIEVLPFGSGGLIGTYFNNRDLTAPALTRLDRTIDFNWGKHGSPDPLIQPDTFSVRWEGLVKADFTERYTFYTQSDDGVRLWVNGELLIDDWWDHAVLERRGSIDLIAGQAYDIRMEYYDNTRHAVARLLWKSASTPKQIIPAVNLFNVAPLAALTFIGDSPDQGSGSLVMDALEATEEADMGALSIPAATEAAPSLPTLTIGLYRDGIWNFGDSQNSPAASIALPFAADTAGWLPVIGDFDGDGVDGLGLYQNGTWILRDTSGDSVFTFDAVEAGWLPIVGDWNNDGVDTIGLYKDGIWRLRNSNTSGAPDITVSFGAVQPGWLPVAGDWNGDGSDTLGLYQAGIWQMTNALDGSDMPVIYTYGPLEAGWLPVAGDWNSDGVDSIGVVQNGIWRLRNSNDTGAPDIGFSFGALNETGWLPLAAYHGSIDTLALLGQRGAVSLPTAPAPVEVTIEVTPEATLIATTPAPIEATSEVTPEATPAATEAAPVATEIPPTTALPPEPTAAPATETPPAEVSPEATPEV